MLFERHNNALPLSLRIQLKPALVKTINKAYDRRSQAVRRGGDSGDDSDEDDELSDGAAPDASPEARLSAQNRLMDLLPCEGCGIQYSRRQLQSHRCALTSMRIR
jgi:hypothetical protein